MRSAYRRILTLNTAQKALLAMRGGREERLILVRDSNKVVALCVLRNPRINDQEIEMLANMRNVSDVVLRTIGSHRAECIRSRLTITSMGRHRIRAAVLSIASSAPSPPICASAHAASP